MASLELMTAAEQTALIRARKASAREVVVAAIKRIEALEPRINAFLTVDREGALKAADAADEAMGRGAPAGLLHGVPVCLKDNIKTRGLRTTAGSRLLEHYVPDEDATLVARLKAAGAIIVGKTHLSEFARGPWVFGDVHNPWDLKRSPGGSSSGTGAAVAASMTPVGIGHDTGGSGRIPASWSGVIGLLATWGRVSRHGVIPLAWSMDHATLCSRTVEDAALLLAAIGGYDPRDPTTAKREVPRFADHLGGGVRGLRIGISQQWFFQDLNPEVERGVRAALRTLEGLGAHVTEVSIPLISMCIEIGDAIVWGEASAYHEENMDKHPEKYGPELLRLLRGGRVITATGYIKAQRLRRTLRQQFLDVLNTVDVLISPTTRTVAPLLSSATPDLDADPFAGVFANAGLTIPFNVVRLPAMSVPCGFSSDGLPIGMQIAGRPFDEAALLRVAAAYQQHTEWHKRRPPL